MSSRHDDGDDHEHNHGQDGHHHPTPPDGFDGAFALGIALNTTFVITEVIFGIMANSVSLLADAAHNLGDVLGLLLAWGAVWLGRKLPTSKRTYGFGRSSILASLSNAVVLLIGVGGITFEAFQRLSGHESAIVDGKLVMIVAGVGILVNGGTAMLFARGRHGDLNIKGAFLHMAADAAVSAGVVMSGLIILYTTWTWVDPVASIAIAALIVVSTWGLLKDSANLAMDHVPANVDPEEVQQYLAALPGVVEVHDLHIWALSTTETALTAHLVRPGSGTDDGLLSRASDELRTRFSIGHATFQIEDGAACALAPAHVV
jgi:cobalt-zinc-cadmium efflux system protein